MNITYPERESVNGKLESSRSARISTVEILFAIASGQGAVFDKARAMIGEDEIALLLAKTALAGTSLSLSPTRVANVLKISRDGARKKTENTAVRL
jgi:hypothetical protein